MSSPEFPNDDDRLTEFEDRCSGPIVRVAVGSLLLFALLSLSWAASPPPVRSAEGMVSAPERLAAEIGAAVLADGGTAIDASIAVAFALDVTYPHAGPVGGGGFLLYRTTEEDAPYVALDFRERAPAALTPDDFLDAQGVPVAERSLRGGLAIGVPGGVAGLVEAHRRWGTRPWPDLLAPSIRLADEGFPVYPALAEALDRTAERLAADPEAARIFLLEGKPLEAGALLRQPDLATTLRRIASEGANGFYRGPVATALVESVRGAGGRMTTDDLADYRPAVREPLIGRYRGHRVVSFPPPSAGGIALLQILAQLERFDLRAAGPGSSRAIHLMVEAERRAFADRARWLGDPDFVDVPQAGLLEPDYLARRARSIRPKRATPSKKLHAGEPRGAEGHETLHFSVTDSAGRAVAMTLTLNQWFGAAIVPPGTGVLLNNEIDDFATGGARPNLYGLTGGTFNAVAGGKRPLSSMTPTLVESSPPGDRPLLVLGSPGGSRIITSVAQVIVNVIDHEMDPQSAVNLPRFHHQWLPDEIVHERFAIPADVRDNLRRRGHRLREIPGSLGNVNLIGLDDQGRWLGAADPRRQGHAAAQHR